MHSYAIDHYISLLATLVDTVCIVYVLSTQTRAAGPGATQVAASYSAIAKTGVYENEYLGSGKLALKRGSSNRHIPVLPRYVSAPQG